MPMMNMIALPGAAATIRDRDGNTYTPDVVDGSFSCDAKYVGDMLNAGCILAQQLGDDMKFEDDFVRSPAAFLTSPAITSPWTAKIVGAAPPTAAIISGQYGIAQMAQTATSEKQEAAIYFADNKPFSLEKKAIFEARANLSVLPTSGSKAYIGVCGSWADGPDAITYSAWFAANGNGTILCETDDNVTDNSVASGLTFTAGEWHNYRIDFTDLTSIKFYIDGSRVASGTTFGFAATGANALVQPYLGIYKASGTSVGTLQVDLAQLWARR